jgi:hypothetical protein
MAACAQELAAGESQDDYTPADHRGGVARVRGSEV